MYILKTLPQKTKKKIKATTLIAAFNITATTETASITTTTTTDIT